MLLPAFVFIKLTLSTLVTAPYPLLLRLLRPLELPVSYLFPTGQSEARQCTIERLRES